MKTLKFNFLFCVLAALCVMAACSKEGDGAKQTYTCSVTIKTAVNDTTLAKDEVYMEALKAEAELLRNTLSGALGLDALGEFVFQATDTTALKAEVAAKCETALAKLGDSWKGYHQVGVRHYLDEKQSVELYDKSFGKTNGANAGVYENMVAIIYDGRLELNFNFIRELGIASSWRAFHCPAGQYHSIDLNYSCYNDYVYLVAWKDVEPAQSPITDVICLYSNSAKPQDYTLRYNGRNYEMVKACADYNTSDCNYSCGGPYLYLMETRDNYDGYALYFIRSEFSGEKRQDPYNEISNRYGKDVWSRTVPSVDENGHKRSDCADLNEGTGGKYVYLHLWYIE